MAILANCRLEKYDVITHTAHVNMVSASAIARISPTQVVEVENCVRGHEAPYNGKCWRGLNLVKWPETAFFLKWRF